MRPWFDFITAVLTWPSIAQPWVILLGVTYSKQVRTGGRGGCRREGGKGELVGFSCSFHPPLGHCQCFWVGVGALGQLRPEAVERVEKRGEGYLGRPDPRPLRVTGLGSIAPSPGINHDLEPASQPASQPGLAPP